LKIAGKQKNLGTYMPQFSIEPRHKSAYALIVYKTET